MHINCLIGIPCRFYFFPSHLYPFLYYQIKMVSYVKPQTHLIKYFERNIDVIMILTISVSHVWTSFVRFWKINININSRKENLANNKKYYYSHLFRVLHTRNEFKFDFTKKYNTQKWENTIYKWIKQLIATRCNIDIILTIFSPIWWLGLVFLHFYQCL